MRSRPKTRLGCEALEARDVPALLAPQVYPDGGTAPAVGDFNNDGVADLVSANGSGGVSVLLGNGDGTFRTAAADAGATARSAATGDFDRDGNLDVVTANFFNLSVLLGNGDGSFRPSRLVTLPRPGAPRDVTPTALAVGDLDGDGAPDLAVTSVLPPGPLGGHGTTLTPPRFLHVLRGQGDGSFLAGAVTRESSARLVTLADFNGDGALDALTAGGVIGTVVQLRPGNGDGTFGAPAAVATSLSAPRLPAVADFDGDGVPDFAMARVVFQFSQPVRNSLSVYRGNGDGTFQPRDVAEGVAPAVLAAGDFNGDGYADLVTQEPGGALGVRTNNGDGTFRDAQVFDAGPSPGAVVVADFNGDGPPDVAAGTADGLAVLLNGGAW